MKTTMAAIQALVLLLVAGCTGSTTTTGRPDGHADADPDVLPDGPEPECSTLWDCNPGVECGSMIPCIDGQCRPDAPPVHVECPPPPPGECVSDADCVVADPWDCCNGCPMVLARERIGDHPCYHERGTEPPDEVPEECMVLCFACPECYPQPLEAACRGGACVAGEQGCPYLGDDEPVEAELADVIADPLAHAGRTYTIRGSTLAVLDDCLEECMPGEPCCQAGLNLGGLVRLEGWPCETRLECWAEEECPDEWECGAFAEGTFYEVVGEVRAGYGRPSIHVEGIREVERSGIGGIYEVAVGSVRVWAEDEEADCGAVVGRGDEARIVVAEAGGIAVATANSLPTPWCTTYSGTTAGSSFLVWLDIDCSYCDYRLEADVVDGRLEGTFHAFDGMCHTEAAISGPRVDP